jgi:hypothetical protein
VFFPRISLRLLPMPTMQLWPQAWTTALGFLVEIGILVTFGPGWP